MKIVVFDDDPTGSQAVYGCPLLLNWDLETLRYGINHSSPLLFILINTRSISPELSATRLVEVCRCFKKAIKLEGLTQDDFLFISRGDSTLRGHGFIEPDVLNKQLGPFDATFHVPAFLEGGRKTIRGIHYLNDIPVHETAFAKDSIFGYSTSQLSSWLEQKSDGIISSSNVARLDISILNSAINDNNGMKYLLHILSSMSDNLSVIVDAESYCHLDVFARAVKTLHPKKKFLFRSAASLVKSFADLPPLEGKLKTCSSLRLVGDCEQPKPGLVIVGSHVPLSDAQLDILMKDESCIGLELLAMEVVRILDSPQNDLTLMNIRQEYLKKLNIIIANNYTPILYTSRGEIKFKTSTKKIKFGILLAKLMAQIASDLIPKIGYIISKGGVTTQSLFSEGLNLKLVELKGQILPGLSIVTCEIDSKNSTFPVVTFPGNLGDENTLLNAYKLMKEP